MEYWEYKADDALILQTDPCHPYTIRSRCTKPSIPVFQYSIIPPPLAADSRHSRLALTWPRGPGFLRPNKNSGRYFFIHRLNFFSAVADITLDHPINPAIAAPASKEKT